MAIRSLDQLEAALTADLKWRTAELFVWETVAKAARPTQRPALLRGGLALVYAHWEGYVKTAGGNYLEYVSRKGLKLGELRPELAAVALRTKIVTLAAEKNPEPHTELVQIIREEASTSATLPYGSTTIRTRANLNYKTFASIMHSLGCDANRHAALAVQIDQRLLGGRNEVAHGREEYVSFDDWMELRNGVEAVLKDVRVQLSNAAATGAYKRR